MKTQLRNKEKAGCSFADEHAPPTKIFIRAFWIFGLFAMISLSGMGQIVTTYSYTGSNQSWTVPAGVTSVTVECWGGGGAGGGNAIPTSTSAAGGGGGGGGFSKSIISVSAGQTYTITVGAGGIAPTNTGSPSAGNPGASSIFTGTGGTVTAAGGSGGGSGPNNGAGAGGAGGVGSTYTGGAGRGGSGTIGGATYKSGPGGGGAGNAGSGAMGAAAAPSTGGVGGTGSPNIAPYKGGSGGGNTAGGSSDANGSTGSVPGGGGGGSYGFNTYKSGGNGGAGQVVITYTACIVPSALSYTSNTITYCVGTAISNNSPTFIGTSPATSYSVSPALPAGLILNTTTGIISGTPTMASATANYTVTVNNPCGSTTKDLNITVNAPPSGGTITGTNAVCFGATAIAYSISGVSGTVTTYSWTVPAGASVVSGAGTANITVNWGTAVSGNVTCAPANGSCVESALVYAVVVNPTSGGGTAAAAIINMCSGGSSSLSLTGYTGSIQWQSSPDGTSWSDIAGATATPYLTTALSSTTYYKAKVTSGVCLAANSNPLTINVVADPTIIVQPTTPSTLCAGGSATISGLSASGGTPSLIYQWKYFNGSTWNNVANGTPAGSVYTNANTSSLTLSGIASAGTYPYQCAISASGNGCTTTTTNTINVAIIAGASITIQPADPTAICASVGSTNIGLTASGATTYQWQYNSGSWNNVTNGVPAGSTYSNAATNALTLSGISSAGTYQYRCIVGNGTCNITSTISTVTVNAPSVGGAVAGSATKCSGTNSTALSLSGHTGSVTKWQYSTDGTNWFDIANTSTLYTATNLSATTMYQAVVTNGACTFANSSPATVTIIAAPGFTTNPSTAGQAICQNGIATALTVATNNATSWQWFSNASASNAGGALISGATSTSYTPVTTSVGTTYYYCVASNVSCSVNSNVSGAIVINAPPTVSITSSSAYNTLCSAGANTSITLTATAGGVSYLWSTGATTPAISVSTAGTYTVTVTNAGCAPVSASSTVQPASINFSAITTASNITGFAGYDNDIVWLNAYPTQSVLFLNGFNGSWTGSIGGAWSPAVSTPTIQDLSCDGPDVTAPPALALVTSDPNLYLGGEGFPFEGSHFVNFNSWVTASGNEGYLTSPVFSTIGLTGVTVDFDFMQFANSSCGSSEYVRVQYCINGGAWVNVSTYRRDGITTSSSTQCPSWMNFAPTLPAGALNQGNVQIRFVFHSGTGCFCGLNLNIDNVRVTAVNTPGGYTYFSPYNWSAAGTAAGLFTINNPSSRSTFTNDLDNNSTTGNVTFTCAMTDANGCTYSASTDTIRVNPSQNGGAGTVTANPTYVCSGGSSVLTYVANGSVPATFQWQQSTSGSGSGFSDIPGANASTYTATNITQTTWYKIKVTDGRFISGICGSVLYSNVAVVTVPKTGTLSGPASVCSGYSATLNITGGTPGQGANSYQWHSSANAGGPWTDLGTTGSTSSFTTGSLTSATYFRVITTTSNPSCTLTSTAFLVSVNAGNIAATNNWNGSISTNWYEVRNWDCMVPVCGQDVLIASGKPRYPIIKIAEGSGAACRSITINSGASLTLGVAENLDVCGNWTNNGTFTPNSGSVTFTGTSAQAMNAPTTSFYKLIINNTGTGVTLGADMNVTNTLTLIDGVVTTNANKMVVTSAAPAMVVNGGTNPGNYTNSWINGNLRRAFATNTGNYDFPVGCASFAALARLTNVNITGITILDATFIAPLTQTTPLDNAICLDFGTPYYACFPEGYWHIGPTTPITGGNYTLKTYFNGFSSINASYDNMFGIVKRASSSSSSMDWSTQIAAPPDGAGFLNAASGDGRLYSDGYAERNTITQFSHFAIAYTNNEILPVTLLNFSGECSDEKNVLKWSTASELNNDYFELQRSAEANTFQTIGIVDGAGNSNQVLNYSFEDMEPYMNSYYRLKQTDFDGSVSLSNIILLSRSGSVHGLSMYPNPFDQSFYVVLSSSSIGILAYRVTDVLGRTVLNGSFDIKEDSNTFMLDMSKISSGSYYLNVENKTLRLFKL